MTDTPNTTQGKGAVDWSRPLIAYDTAGNTRHVHLDGVQTWAPREYRVTGIAPEKSDEPVIFYASGAHKYGTDWRICNVPEHPTPTQYAPELVERMVALLRTMSLACPIGVKAMGDGQREAYETARSIVSDLPQEVDPDLLEARAICQAEEPHFPGRYDDAGKNNGPLMRVALAAIARGRQLQRGEAA